MSAAILDPLAITNALRNEAIPALQALEEHPSLRERGFRRFEQGPPPYESSTDTDVDGLLCRIIPPSQRVVTAEERETFAVPLSERERRFVASTAWEKYQPRKRYDLEEGIQRDRVETWARRHPDPEVRRFLAPRGSGPKLGLAERRTAVISRHLVKRRWQKLGVWNPEWGIPEPQNISLGDTFREDEIRHWAWEQSEEFGSVNHPAWQAVELRQGLRHGEHAPIQPRSHLTASSSTTEAQSFITSRPWFQLPVEQAEFRQRTNRFKTRFKQGSFKRDTIKRWKDRGDWQDKWHDKGYGTTLIGWMWRHESPSPEPDDLSEVENLAGLELTPSETDAFNNIPSPPRTPSPPPAVRYYEEVDLTVESTNLFTIARQNWKRAQLAAAAAAAAEEAAAEADAETDAETEDDAPPAQKEPTVRRSARIAALAANKPPAPTK